jgi:fructan beta-fructosidase
MWRWDDNQDYQLIDEKDIVPTEDKKYHLKVVALDTGCLIISTIN